MLMQSAAAAAATTGPSSVELSLGAWLGIIGTVIAVGTALIKFGEMKAELRHIKKDTEDKLKVVEEGVGKELTEIKRQLNEVLSFIHESQQHRIEQAGWQERTTANVLTAMKDAESARETAHSARNAVMAAVFPTKGGQSK
jgi:hypothetical protein